MTKLMPGRRLALLLLLNARGASGESAEPIEGRTRLQKMLYLLNKEHKAAKLISNLHFEAYAYGPYTSELYDDLAFLQNMRYLDATESGEINAEEMGANEITFDYLMGGLQQDVPERYETVKYRLSQEGLRYVSEYIRSVEKDPSYPKVMEAIENVKSRWNRAPLNELIHYVYSKYPEDARESVIADQY
jgi:uncharacterized protein YwgA